MNYRIVLVAIKETSSIAKELPNQCLYLKSQRTPLLYRVTRDLVHPNDTHTHCWKFVTWTRSKGPGQCWLSSPGVEAMHTDYWLDRAARKTQTTQVACAGWRMVGPPSSLEPPKAHVTRIHFSSSYNLLRRITWKIHRLIWHRAA
jgi:hypothetical protein